MVSDPERLSSVCRPSFERTRVARVPFAVSSRSPRTLVATRILLAGVLRRELSSTLARLTAERLAALANPGGQDASPRRVQQSTYLTSTRLEPFDVLHVSAEESDALDGAPPASAGLPRSPCPSAFAMSFGLRRRAGSCCLDESRALPVPPASSRSREQRSSGRRVRPLRGRVRLPLTLPVVPAIKRRETPRFGGRCRPHRHQRGRAPGPPSPSSRQGRAAVRSGAPSTGRTLARSPVSAIENDSRARSANRLDPASPDRGYPRSGRTGRRCPSRGMTGRATRLRGVGRGLSRAPPPTRRTRWDDPKTDLPEHPVARSWRRAGWRRRPLPKTRMPSKDNECPPTSEPTSRSRAACPWVGALSRSSAGRLVRRAPPRRGARFPEPRVLSKRCDT